MTNRIIYPEDQDPCSAITPHRDIVPASLWNSGDTVLITVYISIVRNLDSLNELYIPDIVQASTPREEHEGIRYVWGCMKRLYDAGYIVYTRTGLYRYAVDITEKE